MDAIEIITKNFVRIHFEQKCKATIIAVKIRTNVNRTVASVSFFLFFGLCMCVCVCVFKFQSKRRIKIKIGRSVKSYQNKTNEKPVLCVMVLTYQHTNFEKKNCSQNRPVHVLVQKKIDIFDPFVGKQINNI